MRLSTIIHQLDSTTLMELGKEIVDMLADRSKGTWSYEANNPNGQTCRIDMFIRSNDKRRK